MSQHFMQTFDFEFSKSFPRVITAPQTKEIPQSILQSPPQMHLSVQYGMSQSESHMRPDVLYSEAHMRKAHYGSG